MRERDINPIVNIKKADLLSPNQVVDERGLYIFKNAIPKKAVNIRVPVNSFFPVKKDGNFVFIKF